MSFLTIRSLSARPHRRLVLGRDGELGPISPNEIDDLLEQITARPEASTSNLLLAERKYGGSKLDWLLQKDQVARIEFNGLRVRNQILRVSWWHDLIVFCGNQQRRSLDSRGVLPHIQTKVNPDGLLDRVPFSRCDEGFNDSVQGGCVKCRKKPGT